jgi:hypothetical protein
MNRLALVALASVALAAAACGKKTEAAGQSSAPSAAPASQAAQGGDADYALTTSSDDCKAGAMCTVTLRLEAKREYHLNAEYPYKYTAKDAPQVEFLGTDGGGKNVFTKAAGDFKAQGEKVGVMTVKFKPQAAGNVTIDGVYKLSVCSEANCKLDSASPKVVVAVK